VKQTTKLPPENKNSLSNKVVLKQKIGISSKVIVITPILLIILFIAEFNYYYVFVMIIFIPIFGFNYEYVINQDAKCHSRLKLFNLIIYSYAKNFVKPEYLSLMKQSYREGGSWIWHPFFTENIVVNSRFMLYTIKFFNGKLRDTVFKTSKKEEAIQKTNELSKLLNVRITNTLKT